MTGGHRLRMKSLLARRRDVLRDAVAERPVLFRHFDQVYEDVLRVELQLALQIRRYALVKSLLLLERPANAERDLDQHDVGRIADAEITRRDVEFLRRVFGDDLELVILRHVDDVGHRAIDDVAQRLAVLHGLAAYEIDSNQWHDVPP